MKTHSLHAWDVSLNNAKAIQKNLRSCIVTEGTCQNPKYVARIQLFSSEAASNRRTVQCVIAVTSPLSTQLLERKVALKTNHFPADTGLASFRVGPCIVAALNKLNRAPDLIICDGSGITGPEKFGVASHIGLFCNLPTIGIKACKPAQMFGILGHERGSWLPVNKSGQLAAIVRVIDGLDPLLVSPAHKIGMESAIDHVLSYVPANLPAHEYTDLLYPSINGIEKNRPPLRLIKNN